MAIRYSVALRKTERQIISNIEFRMSNTEVFPSLFEIQYSIFKSLVAP
ncbi:hypothetical protein SAMN05428947_102605 [Mucilaginibacter sp. OK283]|jgi:hypothetical protein|nr:hypothetical protein SAMN05428947_102605 [Mucilaginibacter sp. OK283]